MLNSRMPGLLLVAVLLLPLLAAPLVAQPAGGTLHVVLTDSSGGVIPGAAVSLTGSGGARKVAGQSDGSYSIAGLAAGRYTLKVAFPGFTAFERPVNIEDRKTLQVPIQLTVTSGKQEVTVLGEPGSSVSVEPDNNATALVVKGADLDALPDDADDLRDTLQALAGPAAGPNGGEINVDGFSGGKLPPKNAIREIRMNQNPFSAEYDRLGMGRIEILTKPGTEKFHGSFGVSDSDGVFNSRNPYAENKADYSNRYFYGNVSGPIGRRASFFLNAEHDTIDNDALINAVTLQPDTLAPIPVRSTVVTPNHGFDIEPRLDYQLSTNHTLSARYSYSHYKQENNGIGQYSLVSRAYDSQNTEHELRFTETAILNPTAVNETRFAYNRARSNQFGDNSVPSINVSEAFSSGGSQVGRAYNLTQRFQMQNNTSIGHKTHTIRFGVRARYSRIADDSPSNFGGTYTFFGVGNAPVLDANNQVVTGAGGQPTLTQIGSLEQYRRTLLFQKLGYSASQIRALGGGPSQFSIAGGNPLAEVTLADVGVFAQDDWRMKPNFTLSAGLRYENQTNVHDWRDFAPRLGLAWSPKPKQGKPATTVLRGGIGMFYDRVRENLTLQQLRFNGVTQQQFLVINPDFFPNIPPLAALNAQKLPVNTYQLDRNLRAPYMLQTAITLEHQLPRKTTVAATFMNLHALHQLRTVNINSPMPGTYDPAQPSSGLRPYGSAAGNLFLYESDGILNQNMLTVNVNTRFSQKVSLTSFYALTSAHSDVDGRGAPSDPYNFKSDYGRSGFTRRHQAQIMGTIQAPFGLRFNPMIVTSAGAPYNLTTGHDRNGDTIANDRPAFATDLTRPSVVQTRFGAFDTDPIPGQTIVPRNYLTADRMWNFNLRLGRSFAFGKMKGGAAPSPAPAASGNGNGGEHRFNLNFNVFVNNVFNHLNHGGFVGNLSSPLFGTSTSIYLFRETSNNRRIQFGTQLSF